jgi:hypothetical protein
MVYSLLAFFALALLVATDPLIAAYFALTTAYFAFIETKKRLHHFTEEYKKEIEAQVLNALFDKIEHRPSECLPQSVFNKSDFNRQIYENYQGGGYCKGSTGSVSFEFSDIKITQVERDRRGHKTETVLFNAPFFSCKLPRNCQFNVMIMNLDGGTLEGMNSTGYFERFGIKAYQEVKLGTSDFQIFSTQPESTAHLLTPQFMQKLSEFKKDYDTVVDINIKGDNLYMVLEYPLGSLQPKVFGQLVNLKQIEEIFDLFELVQELGQEVQLQQKAS